MIPDKIYIRTGMSGLLYGSKEKSFETDDEYIRKEALLEWAKEKVEWYEGTELEGAYQKVIDKLNKM